MPCRKCRLQFVEYHPLLYTVAATVVGSNWQCIGGGGGGGVDGDVSGGWHRRSAIEWSGVCV